MVEIFGFEISILPKELQPYESLIWFAILLGIGVIVSRVVVYIIDKYITQLAKKTKTKVDDIILNIVRTPILVILIFAWTVYSLNILDFTGYEWIPEKIQWIYNIIVIVIVFWLLLKIFRNVVIYYGRIYAEKTKTDIDDVLVPVIDKVGSVFIALFALIFLLGYFGVDITMFVMGMGVIGLVIAFAAQDTLSNFFAGIFLMTDRPFKVGDLIVLRDGEVCEVKHVGMRSTRLYNVFEHVMIVLPNNMLANDKIVDLSQPDSRIKDSVSVGVAYGSDVKKVMRILYEIASSHPNVMKGEYEPVVRFKAFGDSSLDFKIILWIDDLQERYKTLSDIHEEIYKRFEEEGIEIPFPQRTVWMREVRE